MRARGDDENMRVPFLPPQVDDSLRRAVALSLSRDRQRHLEPDERLHVLVYGISSVLAVAADTAVDVVIGIAGNIIDRLSLVAFCINTRLPNPVSRRSLRRWVTLPCQLPWVF